MDGGKKEDDDV